MSIITRASAAAGLLLLALAAGCTVRPMLATTPGAQDVPAALSSISVSQVDTRPAQQVRNHLLFLLHGGAGEPASPRYRLELGVSSATSAAANIQRVGTQSEPTAGVVTIIANYALIDIATGEAVARGSQQTSASFDRPQQEFAVLRAERDAQDRAARESAELVRLALAQDLIRAEAR